ncbi:MAG: hypothetical protein ABI369_05565 [Acetobacteraceae bacterium]
MHANHLSRQVDDAVLHRDLQEVHRNQPPPRDMREQLQPKGLAQASAIQAAVSG